MKADEVRENLEERDVAAGHPAYIARGFGGVRLGGKQLNSRSTTRDKE
jgi:hypothetical protein